MKAGFFATNITPPIGAMRAGGYNEEHIQGIAGPLKVRSAVFENESGRVAFAVVDCCSIGRPVIDKALGYYEAMKGPKLDSFIISATHTHSGAAVSSFLQSDIIDKMSPEVIELTKYSAVPDAWFSDFVARQIATAIFMAASKVEPAVINTGKGEEAGYCFPRRLFCKDGRAYSHPGKMNPDIVGPAGKLDPMVGVVGAWREDGSLIGALVNFCCHGTTYSARNAHADWPHYVEETLQKLFGAEAGVVVLNGPCGDVTQVNNQSRTRDFGLDIAKRLGFRVAAEAAKELIAMPKQAEPTLAFEDRILPVPRRVPRKGSVEEAWETVNKHREDPWETSAVFARERLFESELQRLQPEKGVRLTAIQLGDALFLSNPAEYFTSLSLDIKAASPFAKTMTVELANDCIGYVPTTEAFDPKTGGGYETVLTAYSCLCIDAGERIRDEMIAMSKDFTPDTIPEDNSMPQGTYWLYGKLGPDRD